MSAAVGPAVFITAAQAITIVAMSASVATAAAVRIPSSDLPGRERERFVDPPAARLFRPPEPSAVLPYEARPAGTYCSPRLELGTRKARKHRRC